MAIIINNGKILTTVNGIATSLDCCCGNEQWKDCDTDTNQAVLSQAHTDVDFAWLCLGGTWVKCYNDSSTSTAATDPTVLKQCGTTPTECADLVGWPVSDDFDGTGCNSGTYLDDNWNIRYANTYLNGTTTTAITAGKVYLTAEYISGVAAGNMPRTGSISHAGDFDVKVNFNLSTFPTDAGGTECYSALRVVIGGTNYEVERYAGTTQRARVQYGGTNYGDVANSTTVGVFRITRVGSTITFYIDSTVIRQDYSGPTGNLTAVAFNIFNNRMVAIAANFDNLTALNGIGGSNILIDPTGDSC